MASAARRNHAQRAPIRGSTGAASSSVYARFLESVINALCEAALRDDSGRAKHQIIISVCPRQGGRAILIDHAARERLAQHVGSLDGDGPDQRATQTIPPAIRRFVYARSGVADVVLWVVPRDSLIGGTAAELRVSRPHDPDTTAHVGRATARDIALTGMVLGGDRERRGGPAVEPPAGRDDRRVAARGVAGVCPTLTGDRVTVRWTVTPRAGEALAARLARVVPAHRSVRDAGGRVAWPCDRGPHQIRTRRFPPSGSSVGSAYEATQICTLILGCGRGWARRSSLNRFHPIRAKA